MRGRVAASGEAIRGFDPPTKRFTALPFGSGDAAVRPPLRRPGEIRGTESAVDRLIVLKTG